MAKGKAQASIDSVSQEALAEMLVKEELLTAEQLQKAFDVQKIKGGMLSDVLLDEGLVTPENLAIINSIQLNVPLIDLKRHAIQPQALKLVPEDMARERMLIPLDVVGESLLVAMANPGDAGAIEDIRTQARMNVEVSLALAEDIQQAIDLNYRSMGELEKQVEEFDPPAKEANEALSELVARTPVARSLDLLLTQAVRDRASDIHIEPQENRLRVRFRIDGVLHEVFSLPLHAHSALVSRIKILADLNIGERRRPQDGQFSIKIREKNVDIRAATMETTHGERVTLRILDKASSLFTLSDLGMLPDALSRFQTMLASPYGMILVSGPTGSGKTTTLYASVSQLDRNERNIMTIEDPIEYGFNDISQTQVNVKAGITFDSGLRAILRHDPDIVLVGEIRDQDTADTAVQAALTGHLVMSSIHANDTVGALFRLMDLGVMPYLVASTLVSIVAQRMVRRVCTHCAVRRPLQESEQRAYIEEMKEEPTNMLTGTGCNLCVNTGYRGRTGIFEVLAVSKEIRGLLLDGASAAEMRTQALKEGMVTMRHGGMIKAKQGITSVSEVMRSVFTIS
ncbi:MAG: type II/IV secretion system protein [Dehalococcoidales bacterium]|nr:type II/IV secretion system protein [Dehalococcoidales bacterium]